MGASDGRHKLRVLAALQTRPHGRMRRMPELPEVETTRRGLAPHLVGRRIESLKIRQPRLRWPIPPALRRRLPGQRIEAIERRAKYLLVHTEPGSALLHLGMSGSLRIMPATTPAEPHDHVDWLLDSGRILRFTDPRRFGSQLWQPSGTVHPLLAGLGPEPLGDAFAGAYLWRKSRGRAAPVKTFLMDQKIVVGVGNIYAVEALFAAGIHPTRAAGSVSRALRAARRRGQAHPRARDRARRHDLARFPQRRGRTRLLRAGAVRVRPRGRAVPGLRHADPRRARRAARHVLLRALPAVSAAAPQSVRSPALLAGQVGGCAASKVARFARREDRAEQKLPVDA
jgi:formamidopyrimidine-DNA glycosylase